MNICNKKLYEIGEMIGLYKKDINIILNAIPQRTELSSFELGPKPYLSTFYGSMSIIDFK